MKFIKTFCLGLLMLWATFILLVTLSTAATSVMYSVYL